MRPQTQKTVVFRQAPLPIFLKQGSGVYLYPFYLIILYKRPYCHKNISSNRLALFALTPILMLFIIKKRIVKTYV